MRLIRKKGKIYMKNCINTSTQTIYNKENDNITDSYKLVKLMSKFKNKKGKK